MKENNDLKKCERMSDGTGKKSFYESYLPKKLGMRVKEALAVPRHEQLDLTQELAVFRAAAGEALELYGKATELPDGTASDRANKNNLLNIAWACAHSVLNDIVRTAEAAARIDSSKQDKYNLNQIHDVVHQITRIVQECFAFDPTGLALFDEAISTQLQLPRAGQQGTELTPDKDVIEMDSSVPRFTPGLETEETADIIETCDESNPRGIIE